MGLGGPGAQVSGGQAPGRPPGGTIRSDTIRMAVLRR